MEETIVFCRLFSAGGSVWFPVMHGAYAHSCEPKPGSRVQIVIDAVDESILDAPSWMVNWDDNDGISEVRAAGPVNVWIRRHYVKNEKDPRAARRTSVYQFKNEPAKAEKIHPDCAGAEVVAANRQIALTCARDNVFHEVHGQSTSAAARKLLTPAK